MPNTTSESKLARLKLMRNASKLGLKERWYYGHIGRDFINIVASDVPAKSAISKIIGGDAQFIKIGSSQAHLCYDLFDENRNIIGIYGGLPITSDIFIVSMDGEPCIENCDLLMLNAVFSALESVWFTKKTDNIQLVIKG